MKTPDDGLRPHLSALVDGELEPLEAIAVQRHIRQRNALADEVQTLEQLKLAVHMAGTRDVPHANIGARLRAAVGDVAAARRDRQRRHQWVLRGAAGALAALAVVLGGVVLLQTPEVPSIGLVAVAEVPDDVALDDTTMGRLVALHRGELPPMGLKELGNSGALVSVERLTSGFVENPRQDRPDRTAIMQTSYEPASCIPPEAGPLLVMLRADRITLSDAIQTALESQGGVYREEVEGVSVKVSQSHHGDTILLLIEDADSEPDPI